MVDNLAERVDECPLNQDHKVLLTYLWDCENCPNIYGVAGCLLFRGCLSTKVNGMTELSVISWVFAVEGCPLSGVPLLQYTTAPYNR